MAVSGWGLECLKPPIPLFKKEATGLLFHALHCFKLNEDAL